MARPAARALPPGGAAASCAPWGLAGPPRSCSPRVSSLRATAQGPGPVGGRCVLLHGVRPAGSECLSDKEWGCEMAVR